MKCLGAMALTFAIVVSGCHKQDAKPNAPVEKTAQNPAAYYMVLFTPDPNNQQYLLFYADPQSIVKKGDIAEIDTFNVAVSFNGNIISYNSGTVGEVDTFRFDCASKTGDRVKQVPVSAYGKGEPILNPNVRMDHMMYGSTWTMFFNIACNYPNVPLSEYTLAIPLTDVASTLKNHSFNKVPADDFTGAAQAYSMAFVDELKKGAPPPKRPESGEAVYLSELPKAEPMKVTHPSGAPGDDSAMLPGLK